MEEKPFTFGNTSQVRPEINRILEEFRTDMFGLDEVARLCLVAFFSGGHVLLEGNPGLGKTAMVKKLASVLLHEDYFGRVQFTPDLMPSDITGTQVPDFQGGNARQFKFLHGPVFKSLLLADEINRASPKTQAALLEAMGEKQVTVLGTTYTLPEGTVKMKGTSRQAGLPFMVFATQNPIDHEGTYDLPEAQLDRFMFKLMMPALESKTLTGILGKEAGPQQAQAAKTADNLVSETHHKKILAISLMIRSVVPMSTLQQHIMNLVFASNGDETSLEGINDRKKREACDLAQRTIRYGCGPRGATALMLGSKAWALFFVERGMDSASGSDLLHVALPALRHRLKPQFDWRDKYVKILSLPEHVEEPGSLHSSVLWDLLLAQLCLHTAPELDGYHKPFEDKFKAQLKSVRDQLAVNARRKSGSR